MAHTRKLILNHVIVILVVLRVCELDWCCCLPREVDNGQIHPRFAFNTAKMSYEHLVRFILITKWPDRVNFSHQKRSSELRINSAIFESKGPQREVRVVEIVLRAD